MTLSDQFPAVLDEVRFAHERVELLRSHLQLAGLTPDVISTPEDFQRIPPTRRAQYVAAGPTALADGELPARPRVVVTDSAGTGGGRPLRSWADAATLTWRMAASLEVNPVLALAIDRAAGSGPIRVAPRRCSTLDWAAAETSPSVRLLADGTFVLDLTDEPWTAPPEVLERAVGELVRWPGAWVYGDPAYLALLSASWSAAGHESPGIEAVVLSYSPPLASACAGIRRMLGQVGCMINVLALSEVGWLALECPSGSLHLNVECFHIEVLVPGACDPVPDQTVGELVVTTLGDRVMPRIRYATGDLGALTGSRCVCGHPSPVIEFHGRRRDSIVLPDGSLLTPRRLDQAIGQLDRLLLYQLEEGVGKDFTFHCLGDPATASIAAGRLHAALGQIGRLTVETGFKHIVATPGKFRSCAPRAEGAVEVAE